MADNQLLAKKNADDGFFADDDPLAELARIVSFEPPTDVPARPVALRREPEFNLEDELLKEFELYEAPVRAGAVDEPEPERPPFPLHQPQEQDAVAAFASPPREEIVAPPVEHVIQEVLSPDAVDVAPEIVDPARPASNPVFDLEDEIMREFAAFDSRRSGEALASEPVDGHPGIGAELVDQLIAELAPETLQPQDSDVEPEREAAAGPIAAQAAEPEDHLYTDRWQQSQETAYQELAVAAEPALYENEALLEELVHFEAEQGWDESALVAGDDEVIPAVPAISDPTVPRHEFEVPAISEASAGLAPKKDEFGLDDILSDVDRYPVAGNSMQWSRATPVRIEPNVESEPALPVEQPVVAPTETTSEAEGVVELPAPAIAEAAEVAGDVELHEVFDETAFELDMGEIELDLLEVETLTDSVARQDAVSASPAALQSIADVIVESQPEAKPEPVFFGVRPIEDYSSLPFDPTQISTEDDPVEAIAEMDVPEAPQEHHQPAPAVQADYDIDIDAEMAHLFNRPAPPPMTRSHAVSSASAAAPKAVDVPPQAPIADLDDFERALEEDFRKSMTENRGVAGPDRVALSPGGYPIENGENRSGRHWGVLAASAAAIVLIGGAGVYAFWGGESSMQTVGEPKIILADKDPVKVVPEDKGGQQVPNQDKAVYDRVSGDKTEAGKQERLVSSNEEPVDVVQRTLMPESLPEDDEGMTNVTPTDDTADKRLLSDDAADQNVTKSEKVTSGVAPRKVRTMVVRADGTLVPREEVADDQPAAVDESQSKERSVEVAKADPEVPERLTANESAKDPIASQIRSDDTEEAVVQDKAVEPVVDKPVEAKPVIEDKPVAVQDDDAIVKSDIKPVVAEDTTPPAEDSVDAQRALADAAKADVDPAKAEVEAPVHQVKTVKITDDKAPIPESRPVEQPVNVVGTVTDQGKVKQSDHSQQVAAADPVAQPEKVTTVPAGSYVIQIASLPSEAEAQTSYSRLSSKFANVIGGRGVDIKRAEIKNKGTYYRVRIPAGTKQEAAALCDRYKKAGGSCLVSK